MVPEIEGNSSGKYNSGASGCACHGGSSTSVVVTHNFPIEYDSSTSSYNITIGFSYGQSTPPTNGGFSLNIDKGTLFNPDSNTLINSNGITVTHQTSSTTSWDFQWIPPSSGSGDVTVDISVLSANGNGGNNGDAWNSFSLVVSEQAPSISYSPNSYVLTKDSYTQIFPTINGSGINQWNIYPSLPSGMAFDSNTAEISGWPTVISSQTTYTVEGVYSGGSATTTIEITVNDIIPSLLSYSPNTFVETKGSPMTAVTPTASGGPVVNWAISPSLPVGLIFDTSTGEIWGTPSAVSTQTTYTISAWNTGGTATTSINITVNDIPPSMIAYSPHTHVLTKGAMMTPVTPTAGGGPVVDWSIYPNLPWGLSIDSTTGEISGTPTFISASNTYTVYANNTGGSATVIVTIAVNDVPPLFSYSPSSVIVETGVNITTLTPTLYGQGTVVSWSVTPNLPPGISLDSSTGVISGIPTTPVGLVSYTISGTNSGGTDSSVIDIEVIAGTNPNTPSISLSSLNYTLIFDELMTGITPINSGVPATSWSISPSLPSGLVFYTNNGSIKETPTALSPPTNYTITASNSWGNDSITIELSVIQELPVIQYSPSNYTLVQNMQSSLSPNVLQGTGLFWTVSPTLPSGLNIDSATGIISGTPNSVSLSQPYTVTATNTVGYDQVVLTIQVDYIAPPSINYSPNNLVLTKDVQMLTITPSTNNSTITSWEISSNLPSGLTFDYTNGSISGTPTVNMTQTTYTIWGNNTAGSASDTIQITVNGSTTLSINYSSNTFVFTNGSSIVTITPTINGGIVNSWAIAPALPAGLNFNTSSGEISGTPTATSPLQTYTVTASSASDTDSATLTIEVNDILAPNAVSYGFNSGGILWDFNNGLQNWTVSDPTFITHSTLVCGLNGTSGGSIETQANFNAPYYATSPTINLAGTSNMPLHVWVLQGSSSCGEEPDANEDLQIQYIDIGGNWVTLNTWLGSTTGGTAEQWSTNLPSAALHANTQIRIYQTSGSGSGPTCCDTWFVDDVYLDAPSSYVELTKNVPMNAVTPTYSGGSVQTWSISPALPTGLTINSTTGEISGTPTVLSLSTVYTITATNSAGSNSTTITLLVNDLPPNSITYGSNSIVGTRGAAMTSVIPTVSGGLVTSWEISPNLPTGLSINSTTGEISGTPTIIMNQTNYTIWANNTGGSASTIVTIELIDTPPTSIVYSISSLSLSKDAPMTPINPTSTGGIVDSWSVNPSLPTGLSFNSLTGEISGTPIVMSSLSSYTVTATNSAGSATTNLTIIVNDAAPSSIVYNPSSSTLTINSQMNSVTPTAGGGAVQSWSISPPLPAGLSIGTLNGTIFGTPTAISNSTVYTVTATNLGGFGNTTITIQVNDISPYSLSYSPNFLELTKGTSMTPATPTNLGGTVTSWSISPSLPNGLSFDTVNGTISGTPGATSSLTTYTITGTNSGGSGTTTVTIIINDAAPSGINYNQTTFILTKDVTISSVTPTYTGGIPNSWSISPVLPTGLSFNTSSGEIGGTPTIISPSTVYTVTATNAAGSGNVTITIQVNDPTPPNLVAVNNTAINTLESYLFVQNGTFEILPNLPSGLLLDVSSGEISGIPTQQLSNSTFIVWCNHTDGSSVTWDFTIEILEDSDGDGMPNELPIDYNVNNLASPGIIEDLDDDNDGNSDVDEIANGTNPTNPDTDGDGICDGPVASLGQCIAGPDTFPNDPTETVDTDGDGVGDNADAFPSDANETVDTDGDGVGDNSDAFPNNSNETADTDGDGIGDNADVFPSNSNESADSDGDGVGDNADACPQIGGNSTIGLVGCPDNDGDGLANTEDDCPDSHNSIGSLDSDGDGCLDNEDAFPNDSTEHEDSDGDGIGDNSDLEPGTPLDTDGDGYPDRPGYTDSDDCPQISGNSIGELVGCLDTDGDGLADSIDAFPSDGNRTTDADLDGYDDLIEDDCPDIGGNSTFDLFGCLDSDGDGVSDINDLFPNDSADWNDDDGDSVGNNSDAFPQDANETLDSDGDGVGDNGDLFPQDSNESIDSDGDGIGDNEDQYPLQNNFIDTDNDGIFDVEDAFVTDPTQWQDADNDGYGDNLTGLLPDLLPSDASQWADLDNDGYGDNWGNETWNQTRLFIWPGIFIENASNADHCPDIWGNSSADGYFGCPDLDGDTIADIYDDEINLGVVDNQTQQSYDADNDGIADLLDFCPNSLPGEIVDSEGCLLDQDGDGVGNSVDQCPNTQTGSEVNVEGCAIATSDNTDTIIDELLAGDTDAIVRTVGMGAILIAVIGFMQTNFIAAMLPDAFRWVQVFRNKSKLSAEEQMELGHLQSVVQTYFNDVDELNEELFNLKSDLTARFTNGEIKADTRKLIFTLIGELLTMESAELKRIAHDDRFFGLAGTTGTKERLEMLEIEKAMRSFDDDSGDEDADSFSSDFLDKNSPTPEMKGEINEEDGYEYIEHPAESGRWFIRNTRTNMWDEWKD